VTAANVYVGRSVHRLEDQRFLRGRGQYVGDLAYEGMLHAVVLRSSVPHGRIRSIDVTGALAMPGVHKVLTAADLPQPTPLIPLRQEVLPELRRFEQPVIADRKVRYVGEPLALVVADTQAQAEDALDAIVVDIEELKAVANAQSALSGDTFLFEEIGSNQAMVFTATSGDAASVFPTAPYTRKERFRVQRHTAAAMETRGLLANWDGTHLTVNGAAKVGFVNRRILAQALGMVDADVDLIENDVGGGFGTRGEFYPEDFLIPYAARLLNRPIKWTEDRREQLLATNHARDAECELEIACTRDGKILGLRGRAWTDLGAYLRTVGATASRNVASVLSGPYRIQNLHIDVVLTMTNKTPSGTYRGPGRYEADFFRERLFDLAAKDLGIDRVEFRRRNLIGKDEAPYKLATVAPLGLDSETDGGDYEETLDRCLAEIGWPKASELGGKLVDGQWHGFAVGCYIEGGASGPKENARVTLDPDGMFSIYVGSSALGQGLETVFAQIAADALEIPMHLIRGVYHGSTTHLHEGFGSYSSRSVVMGGSAILAGSDKLRQAIQEKACERLGCEAKDVRIVDGVRAEGPDGVSVPLAELANEPISCDGSFGSHKRTYSYGAHAAHVSVDAATGRVKVLNYVAVEDVGRIINPMTLHGQTVGAIVQGLGGAIMEHLVYDADAQLLTGSLADYLMPTATDFPNITVVALESYPSPNNPLGAKGAGEGGIIPVGGVIANAVSAALASFGVEVKSLPLSPPRVWEMIAEAKAGA
jgi:aerobic carbon-monoxide dehydrogenase large subunit